MKKNIYIKKWNWIQIEFNFCWDKDLKNKLKNINKLFLLKESIYFFLIKNNKILLKLKIWDIKKNKQILKYIYLLPHNSINIYMPEIYQFWWKVWWDITETFFHKISWHIIRNIDILYENKEKYITIIILNLLNKFSNDSWEMWDIIQRFMEIRWFENNITDNYIIDINDYIKDCDLNVVSLFLNQNYILSELLLKNKFNLLFNIKTILPFYIIFIFNMFYLSKEEQRLLTLKICVTLNKYKYK